MKRKGEADEQLADVDSSVLSLSLIAEDPLWRQKAF